MIRNKSKNSEAATEAESAPAAGIEPETASQSAVESGTETLEKLREELETSQQQSIRLMADFDNFRKRVARERGELIRRANEELVTDILPVLDHFELALQQANDPSDSFVVGVRMVYDQLTSALGRCGLAAIEAPGTPFDPEIHDAIAYQASDSVPEGEVILQTRCGYRLGDFVIRPATVIVSSGVPAGEQSDACADTASGEGETTVSDHPEQDNS